MSNGLTQLPLVAGAITPVPPTPGVRALVDLGPRPAQLVNAAGGVFDDEIDYRPFNGGSQNNRIEAYCVIMVAGNDVTNRLMPHLISVRVVDKGEATAEIELDDRDGQLPIPPPGAPVTVDLGWKSEGSKNVFDGTINDLQYQTSREGGRIMIVHARGLDQFSTAKQPSSDNLGEGAPDGQDSGQQHSAFDWMNYVSGKDHVSLKAWPQAQGILSGITKDWWDQNNESLMHLTTKLMEQYHLLSRFHGGNKLDIFAPGEKGDVQAVWGDNLISTDVRPLSARGSWAGGQQHFFSMMNGQWKRMAKQFGMPDPWSGAIAQFLPQVPAESQEDAQGQTEGMMEGEGASAGHGRIMINGEPSALYGCRCVVSGVRPGVDGTYNAVDAVEHIYSRKGYVTMLDVIIDQAATGSANIGTAYQQASAIGRALAQASGGAYGNTFLQPTQVQPVVPGLPTQLPTGLEPRGITALPPDTLVGSGIVPPEASGAIGGQTPFRLQPFPAGLVPTVNSVPAGP